MAERRMFAKTIIDSDSFLDMPLSTQALYFHLSMRADDEGFVNNPKKIARMIGASDDDMKILLTKNFILLFESGVIVIKHWKIHNYIRGDRQKETVYKEERAMLSTKDNGAYTINSHPAELSCEISGSHLTDICPSTDSQMSAQVRLGKVSIGKDSIGEGNEESADEKVGDAPLPKKYGEFEKVTLTDEQYSKLAERFGRRMLEEYIRKLDLWLAEGNRKKNHYVTIIKWITKDHPDAEKAKDDHKSFETDDFWSAALKGSYGEDV